MKWNDPRKQEPKPDQKVLVWWKWGYRQVGNSLYREKDVLRVLKYDAKLGYMDDEIMVYPVKENKNTRWAQWYQPKTEDM